MGRKKEVSCGIDGPASLCLPILESGRLMIQKLAKIRSFLQRGKDHGYSCVFGEVLGAKKKEFCGHLGSREALAGYGECL